MVAQSRTVHRSAAGAACSPARPLRRHSLPSVKLAKWEAKKAAQRDGGTGSGA